MLHFFDKNFEYSMLKLDSIIEVNNIFLWLQLMAKYIIPPTLLKNPHVILEYEKY